MKPTLKKVSKYENKFAKLQKKAAEFNFRNQLKQVKKKEFTLEEEDKEVRAIVFDLIRNLFFFFLTLDIFFPNLPVDGNHIFRPSSDFGLSLRANYPLLLLLLLFFRFFFLLVGRIQGFAMTFALCFRIKYQSCICTRARLQWLKFFRMIFEYFFLFFLFSFSPYDGWGRHNHVFFPAIEKDSFCGSGFLSVYKNPISRFFFSLYS